MGLVDDLTKKIMQQVPEVRTSRELSKEASIKDVTADALASELEKIAYSASAVGAAPELSVKEELAKYAAVHEAITGSNILKEL